MGHAMEEIQKQIANIVSELMPQLCALSDEIFDYAEPDNFIGLLRFLF